MTAEEIRAVQRAFDRTDMDLVAKLEIATQLAELNELLKKVIEMGAPPILTIRGKR